MPFHFLIDIDPIFKISKTLSDGSQGFSGARLFLNFQVFRIPRFRDFQTDYFSKMIWDLFLNRLEEFGVSKVENNRFGESWARPPSQKIMKIMTFLIFGKCNLKNTSPK